MKDPLLTTIVTLAGAETPLEHDVTLIVGGFLVSGVVVSYDKYMKHHATTETLFKTWKDIEVNLLESSEAVDSDMSEDTTPNYIHLRDAKYYTPGQNPIPGNTGVYCRIPLESVHGFSFGLLQAESR